MITPARLDELMALCDAAEKAVAAADFMTSGGTMVKMPYLDYWRLREAAKRARTALPELIAAYRELKKQVEGQAVNPSPTEETPQTDH